MPDGSKEGYTGRQKRKARHPEEGYMKGVLVGETEGRAWSEVNKTMSGGKKKSGLSGGPILKKAVPQNVGRRSGPTRLRVRQTS
jgi:hypothetical protein